MIKNGEILAAAQEERFTRKKHDAAFPKLAIEYCLKEANIAAEQIEKVVFYEKPFLKFERLLETYLAFAPRGFKSFATAMPVWIKDKLFQKHLLVKELHSTLGTKVDWRSRLLFSEHHLAHAASAYFPSPFDKAAVLTLDGVGEWTTTSFALGRGNNLKILSEIKFPHSLGLLYSAFTYYLGFRVNSGEYKVMGLAPYGNPHFCNLIEENLIEIAEDGSFWLDMKYFDYATGLTMTNKNFDSIFGGPPRKPESEITQHHMDIAASIQKTIERILVKMAKDLKKKTGERYLCLAGGVALNCVANGVLSRERIFDKIWVQPAAGDAGGAIGAALAGWYLHYKAERANVDQRDGMKGAYLGSEFSASEVEIELNKCGAVYTKNSTENLLDRTVTALVEGKAIGWMQGRMEFGPRALGARSIIADPRCASMQKKLNLKIKYRESFRPFAPSVLSEHVGDWFEKAIVSPYMLFVSGLKRDKRFATTAESDELFGIEKLNSQRSSVPAITHVDYTARIQTVHADTNPLFHSLILGFYKKTGCPMVVNTSFNVRGEPMVCTPTDAFRCFMGTGLDMLVVGNCILYKESQNKELSENYKERYELD